MEKLKIKHLLIFGLSLIIGVVASYCIGIGIIGENKFSLFPEDWKTFSVYFSNMLSPFFALMAATIAILSFSIQLKDSRADSSLNEQISNYLNHIKLLQSMIDKRWKTIIKAPQLDWEEEPFKEISRNNLEKGYKNADRLSLEIIRLFRLFEDLSNAIQHYTFLHKKKIAIKKEDYPLNEWAHFSISIIQEQDKKMKFCYEYSKWMLETKENYTDSCVEEMRYYKQFYEELVSEGTLNKY